MVLLCLQTFPNIIKCLLSFFVGIGMEFISHTHGVEIVLSAGDGFLNERKHIQAIYSQRKLAWKLVYYNMSTYVVVTRMLN